MPVEQIVKVLNVMPQEQISERTLKNSGYWIGDETVKVVYIILLERVQCIRECLLLKVICPSPPSRALVRGLRVQDKKWQQHFCE